MRRPVTASIAGAALGVALLISFQRLDYWLLRAWKPHFPDLTIPNPAGVRAAILGFVAVGIGIGLAVAAARWHPLLTAVPAVIITLAYLPVFTNLWAPGWYPGWLRDLVEPGILHGLPYTVVGILAASSVIAAVDRRRSRRVEPLPTA